MPELSPFLRAGAGGLVKIGILEQGLGLVDKGKRRLSRRCFLYPVHEVFGPLEVPVRAMRDSCLRSQACIGSDAGP